MRPLLISLFTRSHNQGKCLSHCGDAHSGWRLLCRCTPDQFTQSATQAKTYTEFFALSAHLDAQPRTMHIYLLPAHKTFPILLCRPLCCLGSRNLVCIASAVHECGGSVPCPTCQGFLAVHPPVLAQTVIPTVDGLGFPPSIFPCFRYYPPAPLCIPVHATATIIT
jgi:hypothetical protein